MTDAAAGWIAGGLVAACLSAAGVPAGADLTTIRVTDRVLVEGVMRFGVNFRLNRGDRALRTFNFEGAEYHQLHMGTLYPDGFLSYYVPETGPKWCALRETGWDRAAIMGKVTFISGPFQWREVKVKAVASRPVDLWGKGPQPKGFFVFDRKLDLPGGKPIEAVGIMVQHRDCGRGFLPPLQRGEYWCSKQNRLVQGDVPAGSFGVSALQLTGAAGEAILRMVRVDPDQVDPRGRWHLRFWAKARSGRPELSVRFPGLSQPVELTPQWRKVEVVFEHTQDGTFEALLHVAGGDVLVDDIELRQEHANPTVYYDAVVEGLRALGPGILRGMQLGGRSMGNALAPRRRSLGYRGSVLPLAQTEEVDNTIHEVYALCEHLGCEPWYTLPGALKPDDMRTFMEYLGAPADTGGGALRAAAGHPKPWTDVFRRIHVEFGNEPWNWVTPYLGNGFTGPDYWKALIAAAKASPHYKPTVIFHVAGRSIGKGGDPLENTPNADRATWAPYIIHDVPRELETLLDSDERFFRWVFSQGVHYARDRHDRAIAAARKAGMPISLYEINHHAHGGTAGDEAKRRINASIGGGLDVINSMLIWLKENRSREQCFYSSRHDWYEKLGVWAGVLSYRKRLYRPNWLAVTLANRVLSGNLVETLHAGARPTFAPVDYDARAKRLREDAPPLPALWSYAFAGGRRSGLILLNLDARRAHDVIVALPARPADGVEGWLLTSGRITDTNEPGTGPARVGITPRDAADFAGGRRITLPAFSMTVFRWRPAPRPGRPGQGAKR